MNIAFFYENIDFKLDKQHSTQVWIKKIIESQGYKLGNLNYIFCSDDYLYKMNLKYLNHNTYTDILTFDNSESDNSIESDIFISIDRVKDNSQSQSTGFEDELSRVLVHGVLHLMGWSDKTKELKQEMRKKEDACLSLR